LGYLHWEGIYLLGWLGSVVVGRWTCDQEVAGSIPGGALLGSNSGQVVHTHVPLPPSTGQGAVMFCGWEGNCWSGVALAMRHRLSGLSTYGFKGHAWEMSTPTYAPAGVGSPLPLFTFYVNT